MIQPALTDVLRKSTFLLVFLLFLCACGDGAAQAPLEGLTITKHFSQIAAGDGRTWQVAFENDSDSTFSGVVRHVSRWQDASLPFMTHDILVTSGDFASRGKVDTWVVDHKFIYHYRHGAPTGEIHLLHIFPASEEIYQQLLAIRDWNLVSISGREIFKIDLFNEDGKNTGYFTDMGCNSILVKSVKVQAEGTPVP
jgi:hypothetical protein